MKIGDQSVSNLISISLVGSIIGGALNLMLYVMMSRIFGPEGLGIYSVGLMVVNIGGLIVLAGLDSGCQKYVSILLEQRDGTGVSTIALLGMMYPFVFGLVLSAILIFFLPQLSSEIGLKPSTMNMFIFGIPLIALLRSGSAVTRGFKETKYSEIALNIIQPGIVIVAVLFAYSQNDMHVIATGYIISILISAIYILAAVLKLLPRVEVEKIKERSNRLLSYSVPLILINLSQTALIWVDVATLSWYTSASEVGLYQSAFQLAGVLGIILGAVNSIFPTFAAGLFNKNDINRLDNLYSALSKYSLNFTFFGFIVLLVYGENLLSFYGLEFIGSAHILIILGLSRLVSGAAGPAGNLLIMTELDKLEIKNSIAAFLLNVILNILLVSKYGAIGAAVATSISLIALNAFRVIGAWMYLGVTPIAKGYWKGFLSLLCASFVLFVGHEVFQSSRAEMLLTIVLSGSLFLIMLWKLGVDEDRLLFESVG